MRQLVIFVFKLLIFYENVFSLRILTSIQKETFSVHLLILPKVHSIIKVLNNNRQEKTASFEKASRLVGSIIKSFLSLRKSLGFAEQ